MLTRSQKASAGIVISASHNAYTDNGIKFFDAEGRKLSDDLELEIERMLSEPMEYRALSSSWARPRGWWMHRADT